MNRLGTVLILALCLAAVTVVGGAPDADPQPTTLAEADQFYAERSYAKALLGYQQALAAGLAGERGTELEYRVAICLGRSQQWDEAFAHIQAFVEAHPEGVWAARAHHWLGQLYSVVKHCGYRVGDRLYRGEEYPEIETAEKPEHACLCSEDTENALARLERAKQLYEKLTPREEREEADLNFDLVRRLEERDLSPIVRALFALAKEERPGLALRHGEPDPKEVEKLRGHDWTPTPDQPYDPTQPLPQRIVGLYQQIEHLESGRRTPQARLARALYLGNHQRQMRELMRAYNEKKREWIELPFPYQDADALAILQSIPDEFPRHEIAPQAQLTVGRWLEAKATFVAAVAAYQRVIADWPDSKWVSDARDRIQEIEWPSLQISPYTGAPGRKATLQLAGRNVKTVALTAYRVRLEEVLLDPRVLRSSNIGFGEFEKVFGKHGAERWRYGEKVASWTHVTEDTGEHDFLGENLAAPLKDTGAYVLEADAGEAHAAALVLITDLALVARSDKDRALVFVCDAETGKPVPGADVVLKRV
jgi:hypothetical protein